MLGDKVGEGSARSSDDGCAMYCLQVTSLGNDNSVQWDWEVKVPPLETSCSSFRTDDDTLFCCRAIDAH